MKLIIDIDEKEYRNVLKRKERFPMDLTRFESILANGVPNDCKKLCDIDKLKNEIEYCMWACGESFDAYTIHNMLDNKNEEFVVLWEDD